VVKLEFHGYGLLIGIAIVVGWWWVEKKAKGTHLEENVVEKSKWMAVVGGMLGARLYHVVDYWNYYRTNIIEIGKLWQGGLGIWGAIVGGLAGIIVATKGKKDQLVKLIELAALAMPLSQAIGRLGNWVNGELYGKYGEPLFLYEAVMNLGLFGWINFGLKKQLGKGQRLGGYLVGYGMIRFLLEPLRERIWFVGQLPVAMWFSIGAIGVGIILICKSKK